MSRDLIDRAEFRKTLEVWRDARLNINNAEIYHMLEAIIDELNEQTPIPQIKLIGTNGQGEAVYFAYKGETRRMEPSELSDLLKSYYDGELVKARRGHWIVEPGKIPRCSECNEYSDDGYNGAMICPWCGARMEAYHEV